MTSSMGTRLASWVPSHTRLLEGGTETEACGRRAASVFFAESFVIPRLEN